MTRFVLDAGTRRLGRSDVVLGGSPGRMFRLTPAGSVRYDAIAAGRDLATDPLIRRMLAAGAIHPVPRSAPERLAATTVVIPSHGSDASALDALVRSLASAGNVIVVDDASPQPIATVTRARVVRRDRNGGPAAARNTGLRLAASEFVAFVDDDVLTSAGPSWLTTVLGHFDDPAVALVAPRVKGAAGRGVLGAYETSHGALDLGARPAPVAIGSRISYVPAAAVVVRRQALSDIGGFDETMRLGEDVDMVWRLAAAGWACRYEPASVVHHRCRSTWRTWVLQRFAYGCSAAALAERHRQALPAIRIGPWTAAVMAPIAAGAHRSASAVVVTTSALLARRIGNAGVPMPAAAIAAVQLSLGGHLQVARQLASTLRRAWWPAALVASAASQRARRLSVAAMGASVLDARSLRWAPIRVVDDMAHGAGIWWGAVRRRQVAPLLPSYRLAS